MGKNRIHKKYRISKDKPQSVLITKVIIMEHDSFKILGSGFLIMKPSGESRLDIKDLKGDILPLGWYNVHQLSEQYMGFTTDLIQ